MNTQGLFQIGVSHLLAPVASRERTSVPESLVRGALLELMDTVPMEEAVLLSTCSRLELYGAASDPRRALELARRWFIGRAGVEIEPALVERTGAEALNHLFRVTAGLDSWIIGESEILGQVKRAYETARQAARTGPVVNRAFQSALSAGKAARAQTGIQNGVNSIGGAAALLARSIFGIQGEGSVVVFGAGEAAEAATRHLAAKNFRKIFVANRTPEKASELAARIGGAGISLDKGLALLSSADVAVFSTSCDKPLLAAPALASIMKERGERPLFIIDLGMPRNIAPACAGLRGVFLYNLDDLKSVVARSVAGKTAEKAKAEDLCLRAAAACAAEIDKAAALRAPREAVA